MVQLANTISSHNIQALTIIQSNYEISVH
jgi:hypothetical protein